MPHVSEREAVRESSSIDARIRARLRLSDWCTKRREKDAYVIVGIIRDDLYFSLATKQNAINVWSASLDASDSSSFARLHLT